MNSSGTNAHSFKHLQFYMVGLSFALALCCSRYLGMNHNLQTILQTTNNPATTLTITKNRVNTARTNELNERSTAMIARSSAWEQLPRAQVDYTLRHSTFYYIVYTVRALSSRERHCPGQANRMPHLLTLQISYLSHFP